MAITYSVELQFADPGQRPEDPGPISFDTQQAHLLPNVGDYIQVEASLVGGRSDDGKVRSRLFRYISVSETNTNCHVNIVVERDASAPWGLLIKE